MKNFSLFSAAKLTVALALVFLAGVPANAQLNTPVVIKSPTLKVATPKGNWLKGEVIRADANTIVVREQDNGMMIHTFTYTPDVQTQMQKLLDQGGYQYGDKVKILYQQGQTVALKVRGKPSKAT
jgi:hypothetical protein